MNRQQQNIMVYHHLGLGDHFVCNGLVRHILEELQPIKLFLPTKTQYYSTVVQMYSDRKEVIPVKINDDKDVQHLSCLSECVGIIQVGFSKVREDWDVSFYDSSGVPFEYRWSKFKAVRDASRENLLRSKLNLLPNDKFVLIHNKGSNNKAYELDIQTEHRKIFVEPLTDCVLDWCELIDSADQVHCIDSSFIHLSQSIRSDGTFHNVRELKGMHFKVNDTWSTQEYDHKL